MSQAAEAFQVSDAKSFPRKPFPDRPILRPEIPDVPSATLEAWAEDVGLVLGPLIPTQSDRHKVLCLLYHYRYLNGTDLKDLPSTDLITHRVRIRPGTKPVSHGTQKRWPVHSEWWLRKIVQDGIAGGVYELTEPANGRLSQWNARAVIVNKVEDPTPQDEPRITFDYSRVTEDLPGTYLELSSKVHDNLSDPRHKCLFAADLKHAYLTIPLHPEDRHFFAFTISGIGQVQPTRMQQGSKSAGFTMTEAAYRAFGALPHLGEPSLLHSSKPSDLPSLVFYMDDFFGGFSGFEELYEFLRTHFLPRVEWARFRLSFKKLKLFASAIKALGITHVVGGLMQILESRIAKVAKWPVPRDQSEVRAFLGTVGITRRWVRNFAEIARPLSRLTGKVAWKWGESEQLSFELLKIKCATTTSMHGIDLSRSVCIYTDASGFAAGCAITQVHPLPKASQDQELRKPSEILPKETRKPSTTRAQNLKPRKPPTATTEVPILYDSFTFTSAQRKYPTYKRELCAIATFCKKYDYLCKHPHNPTIVFTDHKPLTHFLGSDLHEGVYGNWADQLRRLNIEIRYLPGPRNKVADGLSRTLFQDPDCSDDPKVGRIYQELRSQGPRWVWKDGKGGFDSFLAALNAEESSEVIGKGSLHGISVFTAAASCLTQEGTAELPEKELGSWIESYKESSWFGEVYRFLTEEGAPTPSGTSLKKSFAFRVRGHILWVLRLGKFLPCVPERKVLAILKEAHDNSGHWAKAGTLVRLRGWCYWPNQSQDVERYIEGCLECARHGPATKSQLLNPILVTYPFELMGMDFIGPLPTTKAGASFILNLICYATNFLVPSATKTANVEEVIGCLSSFFLKYRKPQAFYLDQGQHFNNDELKGFLAREGIAVDYSPSGSSKSTGMIEVHNKLLEHVLRRTSNHRDWDSHLAKDASDVNRRAISYLNLSPSDMLFGPTQQVTPNTSTLLALPNRSIKAWAEAFCDPARHSAEIQTYLKHRADLRDLVYETKKRQKEDEAARYNRGVKQATHHVGDLAMLYQKVTKKLQPRWRGPFRISGYGGTHGRSFTLQQLNGRKVRGKFHGDHLKKFVPRSGYLATPTDPQLPQRQTIRPPKARARLFLRPPKPPVPSRSVDQDSRTVSSPIATPINTSEENSSSVLKPSG